MPRVIEQVLSVLRNVQSARVGAAVRDGRDLALYGISGRVPVTVNGKPCTIVVRSEEDGAPRFVKAAAHRLRSYMAGLGETDADGNPVIPVPVVCAPFLSLKARAACAELDVSWVDRLGNAHISCRALHIDIRVPGQPEKTPPRKLKSPFGAQAGKVLRALLSDPGRFWRVAELAASAGVSIGHVSSVCRELRDRAWGERREEGFVLVEPSGLLRAWSDAWAPPVRSSAFYSPSAGGSVTAAICGLLNAEPGRPRLVLCRNSAAQWIAPFLRGDRGMTLYADARGVAALDGLPGMVRRQGDGQIKALVPADAEEVFRHVVEPAPGLVCTDALRVFLDMSQGNERECEAADHLARAVFPWFRPAPGA